MSLRVYYKVNALDEVVTDFRLLVPVVVVDGTVLVASMGATVAAATGVTVLKIGFCKNHCKKFTRTKQ